MTANREPLPPKTALAEARLMLLFTPGLVRSGEPEELLRGILPWVDVVQIRAKPLGNTPGPSCARDTLHLARVALRAARLLERPPLVLVDDRVDVALRLLEEGLCGVHLGERDLAPEAARALLGPDALIGFSTHSLAQVAMAQERPVDYLGFGPVHATSTKGYPQGLGAELAWMASSASSVPVFPIGGIDLENAQELGPVGRAAVGSAILCAVDPPGAARALRDALLARELD